MSKQLKCLVVDDDPLITELIQHFCSKTSHIEYCIVCNNALDGLQLLSNQSFDILFLDYNMPDIDGKGILELKQDSSKVIMITSNASFAIESYDYHDIIDFIVKPIRFERFIKGIEKYIQLFNGKKTESTKDHFFVKDGSKWIRINYYELLYVKSESNYVSLILKDKKVMSLMNLKDMINELPGNFIRTHRSYIVNTDLIDFISVDELGINDQIIPIGNSYKDDLKKLLKRNL